MEKEKIVSANDLLLSVRDDPEIDGKHFARFKEHINHAPGAVKHGHWVIRIEKGRIATNWAECSECHVCGSPQWKVCPVCETKMDGDDDG
jgi:hypothetical protein